MSLDNRFAIVADLGLDEIFVYPFDAAKGKLLWHTGLTANPNAGPITYMVDGRQYILVCAGDTLFAFTVNKPAKI